ncbi:GMC family oxidoreductase N-terminal domain-containing protein [uncultured Methanobacterium sp.]|uniref:GMC family oxidoreductase N-terminal domain-containing protein n=1 Tax=uncultured Methanobacterium sp. TaxID=176306 RepID=UPI002AA804F0|nr:GMC family oxidoreductase N-terminal domain-containing protein [uncultured Methanobacterium sp.]
MKAIVVGSGAGGATAARELQSKGFEVLILEAGPPFKPFTRHISWAEPLRRFGLLGGEGTFKHFFPPMNIQRSSPELILVRGLTTGGSTVLACGNLVRADRGLKEIGLDLTPEYDELEGELTPTTIPTETWRPVTHKMFKSAENLGLNPQPTPKVVDMARCNYCGLCELGCARGARWDSRKFLFEAVNKGARLQSKSPVEKVTTEKGRVTGAITSDNKQYPADVVVLAAGGIGTAQILKNSGLKAEDHLWVDIVLTLGGTLPGARQLEEPPMAWYTKHEDYILSPYPDILSHYFHKPWRKVPIQDRVGLMVKLADIEQGAVHADGTVDKLLTDHDEKRLDTAIRQAQEVMEGAGISGPFVRGVHNGGHLGGTVPLKKEDVPSMKPSWLPDGLWVADLSLAPRSQGLPTILLTAAMALRVARKILETSDNMRK